MHNMQLKNLQVAPHLANLYAHLMENRYLEGIVGFDTNILGIFSRDVLDRIRANDPSWEKMVPVPIVAAIKSRHLFGYGESAPSAIT